MLGLEDVARLSSIITTRLKNTHKALIDELLEALPLDVGPDEAISFVVGLLSTATFGLGSQMCIEHGLTAADLRRAVECVIADNQLIETIADDPSNN